MGSLTGAPTAAAAASLTARGIECRYGQRTILSDIQLTLSPGAVVGLVGPNGAGKTTLLRVLAGLAAPAAGHVDWFGRRTMRLDLRRRIGYLPDEAALYDELTGLENLRLFAGIRQRLAASAAHCTLLAGALGLTGPELTMRAGTYSFGMRRKLALAQTLIGQPALLLLDEPTLGLDPLARDLLATELRTRTAYTATVLASNDLRFVQDHCHRVVFLSGGRQALEGRPAELLAPLRGRVEFLITTRSAYQPVQAPDLSATPLDAVRVAFRSERGPVVLPGLIDALLRAGNEIEAIDVRHPDLSDVLREQTGSDWSFSWPQR